MATVPNHMVYASKDAPPKSSNWISTKSRLPEKGSRVLVSDGVAVIYAEYRHYGEDKRTVAGFRPSSTGPVLDDVTHWMPLPEPPAT